MDNLNIYYNFKNTIRHFIDIEKIPSFFNYKTLNIDNLSWTKPINFRIKKENERYRTLKIPNILNFLCSYNQFCNLKNFNQIEYFDIRKRMSPNLITGDFNAGVFDEQLENDLLNLCIYDNLLRLDIKSYYDRIYTHNLEYDGVKENFLTNMNEGNTNGLIMGNYISLFFAEKYLSKISNEIDEELKLEDIDCKFSYFSDDFYFFCNNYDIEKIKKIFDNILEKNGLERNYIKTEIWDYLTYNNYNLIEKFIKKIIHESKEKNNTILNFKDKAFFPSNQLIYRLSQLTDEKSKKIFINTFFKSYYFQTLDLKNFSFQEYNYHQLLYIFKLNPESFLYTLNKFKTIKFFQGKFFKNFLLMRYKEVLKSNFYEEQLYYFYAIKMFNFEDILKTLKNFVLNSKNQILISYYLQENLFSIDDIEKLKAFSTEDYWFQNYHLILYTEPSSELDNNINKYLIPTYAIKPKTKDTYFNFYKACLSNNLSFIRDFSSLETELTSYLSKKQYELFEKYVKE